jgi:hypothetical protein
MRGQIVELTASADGTTLAFSVIGCETDPDQTGVIHLAAGQITRWNPRPASWTAACR